MRTPSTISRHLMIPIEMIGYVVREGIVPEFKVLLAAKLLTPGSFSLKSSYFGKLCGLVGYQPRTVRKHLNSLVRLGFAGYDYRANKYYFRSWNFFQNNNYFDQSRTVKFEVADMASPMAFFAGALISQQIKKCESYWKITLKKPYKYEAKVNSRQSGQLIRPVVDKRRTTSQGLYGLLTVEQSFPEYDGIGNLGIAKLLNCCYTYACELKHRAEKAGYIITKSKFELVKEMDASDYSIRSHYYKFDEDRAKRLRFLTLGSGNTKKILLVRQLHDEILPCQKFGWFKKKSKMNHSFHWHSESPDGSIKPSNLNGLDVLDVSLTNITLPF